MLPTHEYIKTYQGYEIYRRRPGFEFTPMLLGKIASFVLRGAGQVTVAAFMYPLLPDTGGAALDEDHLLGEAVATLQSRIDAGQIAGQPDLTFEYREGAWVEVASPRWWIPVSR